MAEYTVQLKKTVTWVTEVYISADSEDAVDEKAKQLIESEEKEPRLDWELDDEEIEVEEVNEC